MPFDADFNTSMTNVRWRIAFEGQQCTINDSSLASLKTLARGVIESGLYRLLLDPMALVHSSERMTSLPILRRLKSI
jgi:hypothetical protein